MSLLLHLAENPTNILGIKESGSDLPIKVAVDEDANFDWVSYLREGEENFHQDWDDDSSIVRIVWSLQMNSEPLVN